MDKTQVALVLVTSPDGLVLAVSRQDEPIYGLPGGIVEENETLQQTAVRETFEETGLIVSNLVGLYEADYVSPRSGKTYRITTFRAIALKGLMDGSNEGSARWLPPRALLHSAYGEYNRIVLIKAGLV